jgi:hypothetical protein
MKTMTASRLSIKEKVAFVGPIRDKKMLSAGLVAMFRAMSERKK